MHLVQRSVLAFVIFGGLGASAHLFAAEDRLPSYPPIEAANAANAIRVKNGFTMDLLAAEPLITSPVAVTYDENGVGYVVEMRDYPYTNKNTHQAWKENTTDAPTGRITQLIDRDGDGKFDESHVFAEGISWPTGICVWQGGVLVTATPDIWYFKDTDGDHRADIRERVFTGFRKFNVQAVINTPLWGLDNRITVAGATNGGQITSLRHPDISPLRIARNDLRIDPRNGRIEAIAGGARFGQAMDDWGNRFLCNIRNPAQHVVFDGTLAARNPFLPVPNPVYDARESGDTLPVLRISPMEPWRELRARRWTAEKNPMPRSELVAGGVFTSAAGITIYRGSAYPKEYYGQAFVAEVANNLVHRMTVARDGVTFKIQPADLDAEFVASTDLWFRPVNFINAPDGTLHVVDMYRETIEHPWSIPDDIRARLDLEAGRDRGRLYRLAPPGFKVPKPPRLGAASIAELVATLENPNSWWRETAQRLLFERQSREAIAPLQALLSGSEVELARLHALWTLDGLGALSDADLSRALTDASAGVREHAVRLAAARLGDSPKLQTQVFGLARDPEIRVRYQVAFAAGSATGPVAVNVALEIIRQDAGDRWVRAAALSASPDQVVRLAQQWLGEPARTASDEAREIARQLAFVTGAQNQRENLDAVYAAFAQGKSSGGLANNPAPPAARAAVEEGFWLGLGDGLRQAGTNLRRAFPNAGSAAGQRVGRLLQEAAKAALAGDADMAARTAAVKLLAHDDFVNVRSVLSQLLIASEAQPIQVAAVRAFATYPHADVAKTLLAPWASYTPAVREEAVAALLARRDRIPPLLTALEANVVSRGQISVARRTQLLANTDATIKARAEKIFGQQASGSRRDVVASYQPALALTGDAARGAKVYDQACAACHRYAGRGVDIGPNLETVRGWDREKLLLNILDPNREVAANYIAYTVELKDGGSLTGMVTEEAPGSIKLKRIGAAEETILRQNIAKITGSSASLMPEGLEAVLPAQEMADLLAHLTAP